MPGMIVVHGLASCDTTRAARKLLKAQGVTFQFRDFGADAPSASEVGRWAKAVGAGKLLNKSSTTWRALPEARKSTVDDADVIALLVEYPKLMKRPLLEAGSTVLSGFNETTWQAALNP